MFGDSKTKFYDDSILPGTKTKRMIILQVNLFYDDSILPGTKTVMFTQLLRYLFYDDSILPGTKTDRLRHPAGY